MNYGRIEMIDLSLDIYKIELVNEGMVFCAVARSPHPESIPPEGIHPFAIYGQDGVLFTVGKFNGSSFREARANPFATVWYSQPIKIVGGLECK